MSLPKYQGNTTTSPRCKLAYYDLNTQTVEHLDIKEELFCRDFAIYWLNLLPFRRIRN